MIYGKLFLSWSIILLARIGWGQCVTLKGKVINAATGQGVSVHFSVRTDDRKQAIGTSTSEGFFSILLPCKTNTLMIEKQDFRTLTMPISGNEGTGTFFFELGLYPVDKQVNDRPYFQSEQKETTLENIDSAKSNKNAIRYFKLIDEATKTPIKGEVCLLFTQGDQKKCFSISRENQGEKVVFSQQDIVGVVVTANGYQTYNGNLIIDQLDNQSLVYEISLSKMISLIAFSITKEKTISNLTTTLADHSGKMVSVKMLDEIHGFANVNTGEQYVIKLKEATDKKPIEQVIRGVKGLFLVPLTFSGHTAPISTPTTAPVSMAPESISLPIPMNGIRVIFFKQSLYDLPVTAQQTLDSVANWLKYNTKFKAQITGFTDNVGDSKLNKTLSEFRAKITVNYLLMHGVPENQLFWQGKGGEYPAAPNDMEANKALNRRVEIKILDDALTQSKK